MKTLLSKYSWRYDVCLSTLFCYSELNIQLLSPSLLTSGKWRLFYTVNFESGIFKIDVFDDIGSLTNSKAKARIFLVDAIEHYESIWSDFELTWSSKVTESSLAMRLSQTSSLWYFHLYLAKKYCRCLLSILLQNGTSSMYLKIIWNVELHLCRVRTFAERCVRLRSISEKVCSLSITSF